MQLDAHSVPYNPAQQCVLSLASPVSMPCRLLEETLAYQELMQADLNVATSTAAAAEHDNVPQLLRADIGDKEPDKKSFPGAATIEHVHSLLHSREQALHESFRNHGPGVAKTKPSPFVHAAEPSGATASDRHGCKRTRPAHVDDHAEPYADA